MRVTEEGESPPFSITDATPKRAEGNLLLLRLVGDLDTEGSRSLEKYLGEKLRLDITFVVLNLDQVTYIGNVSLGSLLTLEDVLRVREGGLLLVKLKKEHRRLFDLAGLFVRIRVYKTEEEALAKAKS